MREGWTYKKLGEVASYINGYAFKPEQWKESGTPIIRIQNLNNPEAPYNYYDGEVPEKVKIQNGDLLISWSASLGAYIWDGGAAFLNQHIFKVEFDKTDIDKMYLKYAVTSKLEAMANLVHGATMKHIVKKDFDNTLIPYPSKSQQAAIVSELDEITSLLALKHEQLQKYDKLEQSLFYEMFGDPVENEKGWEVKKLNEFATLINGRAYKQEELLNKGKYPVLRVGNFFTNNSWYYSDLELDEDKYCDKGDLLYAWSASFGPKIWEGEKVIYHYHIWKVVLSVLVDKTYLFCLLERMTKDLKQQVHGATMVHLTKAKMEQTKLPLPPLPLQQQFASRIEQIESQKQQVQAAIERLETLLASRMQYWFE